MGFNDEYQKLRKKRLEGQNTDNDDKAPTMLYQNKTLPKQDVAPIVTANGNEDEDEGKKKRTWFNKGEFEDGYQFGDVIKTIAGTGMDLSENLSAGILGMGEKVVDAGAYLVGGAAGLLGADDFKEKTGDFIAKDLYDEEEVAKKFNLFNSNLLGTDKLAKKLLGIDDDSSLLGEKTDALAQSGGQLLGTIALQGLGVPWWVTSGTTSFGSAAEGALNEGATYGEAGLSAAISAGAEILTEKLFGGSGLGEKGLINLEPLTKGISSKVVKALADLGVDMAAEGAEEVISSVFSNLGSALYKEESLDELLFSEEAVDEYIESFVGGAALGGIANTGKVANSIKTGTDYRTGLTTDEQAVFDNIYNDRIAEQGEKLTKKQKAEIYDQVMRDMERGYISTDDIERILGGETYAAYQNTLNEQKTLQDEYDALYRMKNGEKSDEQIDRQKELKAKLEEIAQKGEATTLETQLHEGVFGRANGTRLAESYRERARRGQAFEADLSRYDAKQAEIVKKAAQSGILNNTGRTHEFVDMIAKISADKGVLFDFVNNAKLKESGFAVEGATVNGYFDAKTGTIGVNIDSAKALDTVVGHEITHVLEGTELYTELQKAVFDYARTKGEYDGRREALAKLYAEEDIDSEMTADLIGEYLFTDEDFVKNLSVQNRNVFQKIYDEIKYLYKVVTAGSKEARELERVKRAFDKAYREGVKADKSGTKYSLSDKNIKDVSTGYASGESYYTMSYTQDGKVVGTLEYGEYDGEPNVKMIEVDPEYRRRGIATKLLQELQNKYPDVEIDFGMSTPDGTKLLDAITYDVTDQAIVADRQKLKDLQTELNDLQEKLDILYDAETLSEAQETELHELGDRWQEVYETIHDLEQSVRGKRATKTFVKTGTKYSLSDSDGKQLTKGQQEYFKDSKMRDENGNLMVMYHGSQDAGFHVFDPGMSDDDISFFFVDRNDVAASYSGTTETYEAQSIRTAEDMNKFIESIGVEGYEVIEHDGKFDLIYEDDLIASRDTAKEIYEEFCWYESVGEGDANYKVYLNLKNPLVVDANGRPWNKIDAEFSQEIYDKYQSLTAEEMDALIDLAEWEDFSLFNQEIESALQAVSMRRKFPDRLYAPLDENTKNLASAFEKIKGGDNVVDFYGLFDIAADNFSEETIRENAVKQLNTRDYAQRAKEQGYDGVIFNNIVDVGGYGNGSEGAATVAVAFESEQIKSVANENPTGDPDIRYSLSQDNQGRELSAAQRDYFKDSKVVDENGSLMVMYHGTPNGDFTVFKDGTYFTENKWYADLYQNPGASSISTGKVATNPKTYEVYLDIKKPFDISDAEARSIYINDYIKGGNAVGINPYLSDAEYDKIDSIDWTEGEDLREFLIDNGYDYDGLVLDEGAVGGYGDDVKYRGKSYVVFSPEQVKNVDNVNPTSGPDIRYSLTEYTAEEKKAHNDAVLGHFGRTFKWAETGYLLLDGARLDLSGKHDGAPGGYRTVDHRDITDALGYDYGGGEYSGSLIQFMSEGNIRIVPEIGGINLSVKPTKAQEQALSDFISRNRGEVVLDIDDLKGNTVVSVEYPRGTFYKKVLDDIREWFDNGKQPEVSGLSSFRSLSTKGEAPGKGRFYGKDMQLEVAPVAEDVATTTEQAAPEAVAPEENVAPVNDWMPEPEETYTPTLYDLIDERDALREQMIAVQDDLDAVAPLAERYTAVQQQIQQLEADESQRLESLDDADVPPEVEAPYYESESVVPDDPFENRDIKAVGDRKVKAYMYENPEVKPFFQAEANILLGELSRTTKGERFYTETPDGILGEYGAESYGHWTGVSRDTSPDIAYLLDTLGYSYDQIEKGLQAIIKDNGAENNACSKRIEFLLHDRLVDGYDEWDAFGQKIPPNQEYINLLKEKQIMEYSEEARKQLFEVADRYAPPAENSEIVVEPIEDIAPVASEAIRPQKEPKEPSMKRVAPTTDTPTADVIAPGTRVRASDRGNIGTVKSYDAATGKYKVSFTSRNGMQATVALDASVISPLQTPPTKETVTREVFNNRAKEVYHSVKSKQAGKYHKVGDYGFHLARSGANESATITVKTPDGKKLQRVIQGGNFWKNSRLWSVAANMVAEHEYPNVETPKSAEDVQGKVAEILVGETPKPTSEKSPFMTARTHLFDRFSVFEDVALEHGNRELDAKANYMRSAVQRAQYFIGHGADGVRALADLEAEVDNAGLKGEFYEYMYDLHNTDRMSLEDKARPVIERLGAKFGDLRIDQIRAIAAKEINDKTSAKTAQTIKDAQEYLHALETQNKPVRGYDYTADISRENTARLEAKYPQFKKWAQDVYAINNYMREVLVQEGMISRETADLWAEVYPHYVPIRRAEHTGSAISVPLDTNKTGVNAPVKRATGGDGNIEDLFNTMALRAMQTYNAAARNSFGAELMNTLGTTITRQKATLDEAIDGVESEQEGYLKKGEKGAKPTFTVFVNGERVEFEITEDMYEALKPQHEFWSKKIPGLSHASEGFRKILTEYNLAFTLPNAIKDAQDVIMNSQHPLRTYANMPNAYWQVIRGGEWNTEYMKNGGEQNTYFDSEEVDFKAYFDGKKIKAKDKSVMDYVGMPLNWISNLNNVIERVPRLAEYMASRKAGASAEVAMLDAARVTTNFAAGGDITKFANRNGVTFLNASVQGFNQQVRNVREAKAKGFKGWAQLAAKTLILGVPALILNGLIWDDDDDYEELSDYVKQNYYVIAKYGDGKFVRIPKGRAAAVIQNAMVETMDMLTGDDEKDLQYFLDKVWGMVTFGAKNLAPNNPIDNNILAPISDVAKNETWYGEDLVPSRLQDLPAAEQYDESTDAISRWLGETAGDLGIDISPYKVNYLLDQYSGGVGDVVLPMLTPDSDGGGILAPFNDKFTTDSTMKNQNVSDFYNTVDELTKNAKSSNATDEDVLKYKYMNSINAELSELYKQKREIQNSDLPDDEKYDAVRDIQKLINSLASESLETYKSVYIKDGYATVGDRHYKLKDGEWQKISDDQLEKQNEVVDELGIDPSEYWANKSEYDFAYEYPEKYAVAKSVGGYERYKTYSSELYDIKADKDENGKSITGSRKEKVIDYINNLDADYGERLILFKNEYNADDTYNEEIIDYLNNREDITYDEMVAILTELGFTVKNGHVYWD